MTTYAVFIRESTADRGELDIYDKKAAAAAAGHPLTALALYGAYEVLEGAPIEGAVILSFPTKKDALEWYNSPEYSAAREHRFKGAKYNVFLIEGV